MYLRNYTLNIAVSIVLAIVLASVIVGIKNLYMRDHVINTEVPYVSNESEFVEAVENNVGNVFVYGNISSPSLLHCDELELEGISGEYLCIKKVQQRRIVSYVNTHLDNFPSIRWNTINSETIACDEISIYDVVLPVGNIQFPEVAFETAATIYEGDLKTIYYVIKPFTGTCAITANADSVQLKSIRTEDRDGIVFNTRMMIIILLATAVALSVLIIMFVNKLINKYHKQEKGEMTYEEHEIN